jgi:hypothetical protein
VKENITRAITFGILMGSSNEGMISKTVAGRARSAYLKAG